MFNFFKKIVFFILPIFVIFIFPIVVYVLGREYYSVEETISEQLTDHNILYGLAFSSLEKSYKKELLAKTNPEVIVLGASRSVEFRREFFAEPDKFFNAGNGVNQHSVASLQTFMKERAIDSRVKMIILSLDPIEFVQGAPPMKTESQNLNNQFRRFVNFISGSWRQAYVDVFVQRKFSLHDLVVKSQGSQNIGLQAIINSNGYRFDGSYAYNKEAYDSNHRQKLRSVVDGQLASIRQRGDFPEYGQEFSQSDLDSLNDVLRLCREENIDVLGFFSPRPSAIYRELTDQNYPYHQMVVELPQKLSEIFANNNFAFYDLSEVGLLGGNDNEFLDWIHGTDKMYLRITKYLAEKNPELSKYVDLKKLQIMLNNNSGDFLTIN